MGAIPLADNPYPKRRPGKRRRAFVGMSVFQFRPIQEIVRKQAFERALNTSDIKEARRLKLSVLAEILDGFERARRRRITSADMEHEAQRYLRATFGHLYKANGRLIPTHQIV